MATQEVESGSANSPTPEHQGACCGGKTSKFKKICLALAAIVAVVAAFVAMQPSDFHVERSLTISAPPSEVFAQVNDFHNWEAWSPWAKMDPDAKNSFEGPSSGTGAIFSWDGNAEVGAGSMTIMESRPNELIRIKQDFVRPMAAVNTTEFEFKGESDQTVVTWSMFGRKNFLCKGVCLFMSMDAMIGDNFEKGLAEIKAISEKAAQNP